MLLVGRHAELEQLDAALERARRGSGSLVLVAGVAGVGTTRLSAALADGSRALVLSGRASRSAAAPYAPVVAALRSHLRSHPDALAEYGPLLPHLALLLPELGEAARVSDQATVSEAVDATLDLLGALAEPLSELPILVVAAYRSDGLPRDHALRRLRHELRRSARFDELTLAPLGLAETAELLTSMLDDAPAPSLTRAIHDRARGLPFFIEELASGSDGRPSSRPRRSTPPTPPQSPARSSTSSWSSRCRAPSGSTSWSSAG